MKVETPPFMTQTNDVDEIQNKLREMKDKANLLFWMGKIYKMKPYKNNRAIGILK